MQEVFDDIYKHGKWAGGLHIGDGSGLGSETYYTVGLRNLLINFIKRYNIKTIIDAPCGACKWTSVLLDDLEKENIPVTYYGVDIASQAVERAKINMARHNSFHKTRINQGNLVSDQLPKQYDLVLCRDTLQHLSFKACHAILNNLADARAKYYLIGGYWPGNNTDITDGETFMFNITQPPFRRIPLKIWPEDHDDRDGAWPKHLFMFDEATFTRDSIDPPV